MEISDTKYFSEYTERIGAEIKRLIAAFDFSATEISLDHVTHASAVFLANIEVNALALKAYLNEQNHWRQNDQCQNN
jgi:hypothetical protein